MQILLVWVCNVVPSTCIKGLVSSIITLLEYGNINKRKVLVIVPCVQKEIARLGSPLCFLPTMRKQLLLKAFAIVYPGPQSLPTLPTETFKL